MKKYLFLLFFAPNLYSQTLEIDSDMRFSIGTHDTLAITDLCVIYHQHIQEDSTNREKIEESQMMLQIGGTISKYANYIVILNDSINRSVADAKRTINAAQVQETLRRLSNSGDRSEIFKNYPTASNLSFRRHIGTFTAYEEDIPEFSWSISDETLDVLGYECRKATCRFRGRDYIAWFAPEIPVSNGPWKFGGLPGLILKAEDSKAMFRFEAFSAFKPTWNMPITYSKRTKIDTTREKYNQAEKRFFENPGAILLNKPGVKLPEGSAEKAKLRPYNPMELE